MGYAQHSPLLRNFEGDAPPLFKNYFNNLSHIIFMRKNQRPVPKSAKGKIPAAAQSPPIHDSGMELMREIRDIQIEIENLKRSVLSQPNIRAFESDFLREFQRLSKEVRDSLERNRHAIDKMEAETKFLREDMGRIMSLEEEMNRLNMKSIARDIEGLKEKSHWLEANLKGFDIDPLVEKISEIEDKIKILKASQPLILE